LKADRFVTNSLDKTVSFFVYIRVTRSIVRKTVQLLDCCWSSILQLVSTNSHV